MKRIHLFEFEDTKDDLGELLRGLEGENYTWEIGTLRKPGVPGPMLYALGLSR